MHGAGISAAQQLCALASKVALNFHKYLTCMPFSSFNLSPSAIFLSTSEATKMQER
jgi:hypothetical protein